MKNFSLKYYPEIIGILVFIIYMFTISPSVGENDSGELATAQATLSIPHPTGYPLFILLGFIFSKIPLPMTTIFKLNLLSAVWCALTVIMVIRICLLILENFDTLLNTKSNSPILLTSQNLIDKVIASIFAGLMLAFSATFWLQSTRVEVYSLQVFLSSLIMFLTLKIFINYEKEVKSEADSTFIILKKWWVVFALFGFGFANHMMTLYLLPSTLILFFSCSGFNKNSLKSLLVLFLITGLISSTFYLGLMIRANMSPKYSYGDPSNIKRLVEHITARDYSQYILLSTETIKNQSAKLLKMLSFNFSTNKFSMGEFSLSLFLGFAGLLLMFLFKKKFAAYFFLIIIISVSMALSYNIPDINEYFLVPFMILSISSIIPTIITLTASSDKRMMRGVIYSLLIVFVLIEFKINYNYADRSKTYIFEDFFKASISDLPPNSILLTDDWVAFLSPGFYYQNIDYIRKDVSIISPSGIILHQWYRPNQKIDVLDSNLVIIKNNNLYVAFDVVNNLISKGLVFLPPQCALVPEFYFYRLVFDNNYYQIDENNYTIRFNKNSNDEFESYLCTLMAFMLEQRILYELDFNKKERASYFYEKLKKNFSNYEISAKTYMALIKSRII